MVAVRFGISTHLFHDAPLGRAHLQAIADAGFDSVELFATRTHFDYHDAAAAARLGEWLAATGLTLHSVHAPITDSLVKGVWGTPYSNAAADAKKRAHAVQEAGLALDIARTVPYAYLVVHVGVPDDYAAPGDNARESARRSIEEMAARAAERGVQLALEVIPNALSTPESLVHLIEEELELPALGICMDVGHAHVMNGEAADAIETVSGHLVTTHLHDNDGKRDLHLTPFAGSLDWPATLMGFQKVGYDGVLLMELANTDDPARVLDRARRARSRFEEILAS
jgi:sugar phosphate isomerase/epimerase